MSAEPDGSPPPSYDDTIAQDTRKQSNGAAVIDVTMENGKAEPDANGGAPTEANGKAVVEDKKEDEKKEEKKDEYERKVGVFELVS